MSSTRRKYGRKNGRSRNPVKVRSQFAIESIEPRVLLSNTPLVVTEFAADASGFTAHFNQAIDSSTLNLYDTETGSLGPADVTVVGASAGSIKGTLTVDNDTLRFIKTGGVFSPDIYTVTMRGASNGVKAETGDLLDGNNDGIAGDNYVGAFTMNPVAGITVGIADFARGPGQVVQVPALSNGIPVSISNGSGVTSVDFTLTYDSSLLTITAVSPGAALPAGSIVESDLSEAGTVTIHVTSPTPMLAGPLELVRLVSQVPHTATYGATGVLDIGDLSINHGSLAATADDGVEVAAFFGEATGNGGYSSLDGSRILRVVVGLDTGFPAYPYVDPVLLTDITGNGIISSLDGTRILQEIVGLDRAEIEAITAGILAHLANDTGVSAIDSVTKDPSISGTVKDDGTITNFSARVDGGAFVNVTADLINGNFSFNRTRLEQILGAPLGDGSHTLAFRATDNNGNVSTISTFSFKLDTTLPVINSLALSAGSDTGTPGDGITSATQVQLVGSAEAGSTLFLNGQAVLAGAGGVFQLPGVTLNSGVNSFQLTATDLAGNSTTQNLSVTQAGTVTADVALQWNQITLDSVRLLVTDPPIATRILAMVSLAQYDTLAAIEGTPAYLIHQTVAGPVFLNVALAKAAHTVLYALYPSFRATYDTALNTLLASFADGPSKTNALALGLAVGNGVLSVRANDGSDEFVDYPGSINIGQWRPTAPMFDDASEPQWGDVTPFALSSGDELRPGPPPDLGSAQYAQDVNEIKLLGSATGSTRTADQTQIAHFWADGKGSYTPPGHWNLIAQQVALSKGNSLSSNIRLFAELNVALADAAIAAWDAKYEYNLWRPIDAIHFADQDSNAATLADSNWTPLLITPSFPEYLSGHSTFSSAAAGILSATFGDNTAFSIGSFTLPGVTRNFSSFTQAALEAGRSRVYGGIHYEFTNQVSKLVGAEIAATVLERFQLSQDITPPVIVANSSPAVTNANLSLTGQIIDNLSGVAQAKFKIDDGFFELLTLDSQGHFSITTPFVLNGTADGTHTISISARDASANDAPLFVRSFTLDTVVPIITLNSIADNSSISATSRLTGAANPTGSTLTSLLYKFDNGSTRSISFNNTTGAFDEALFIGNLTVGSHTLTLTARDAAGNLTTLVRNVTLESATPFIVASMTPDEGTPNVGVTFRPQVVFSRSVNAGSLTSDSFYATGSDGQKIAATIVTATDGSFAWLFFTNPLPGGATITVHLDGSLITAAADQQSLDGNGDGTPGGVFLRSFTTVSTASVAGTTLVGKVVDPGPDLEPMTFDDIRRGPDGVIHTPDDVFLNPIVHAKVYILGRESNFVFTDASGNFQLDNVPTGNVKIVIDGRTATNAPAEVFFPEMVVDANMLPGLVNTIMGSMTMDNNVQGLANLDRKEVYLPRLQTSILQNVSNTENTVVSPNAVSSPDLTDQERQALSLTVVPNSAIGENGQLLTNVQIGVSTVPDELVQDMLPPGVLQHTFDITIQAPGVATFAQPLQISFPNVFNAAPGEKLFVLSFDHTTGRLVINGTATVSADGLSVVSDPDSGIKAPGWHGLTPPGPNGRKDQPKRGGGPGGGPGGGGPGGGGPGGSGSSQDPDDDEEDDVSVAPVPFADGLGDQLFVDDAGSGVFTFRNDASPIDPSSDPSDPGNAEATPLIIEIDVDGPAADFLIGLFSQSFSLLPGEEWTIPYEMVPLIPTINDPTMDPLDRLYGVTVHVIGYASDDPGDLLIDETFYIYRYLDARDSDHADGIVEMADTAADGIGGVVRDRGLEFHTAASAFPTIDLGTSVVFGFDAFLDQFFFDPFSAAEDILAIASILDPNGDVAGTLDMWGDGTMQQWYIDEAAFLTTLSRLGSGALAGPTVAERALFDTVAERQAIVAGTIAKVEALLAGFGAGWLRVLAPTASSINVIDFEDDGGGILGLSTMVDANSNGGVANLVALRSNFNIAEQNFRLSEALNETGAGTVDAYIDSYLTDAPDYDVIGVGKLINSLAHDIAHEMGHEMGLFHTANANQTKRVGITGDFTDVMAQGTDDDGVRTFDVTADALRVSLGTDWASVDAQIALDYYEAYITAGGNFNVDPNVKPGGPEDPDAVGIPVNDGVVAIAALPGGSTVMSADFGTVSVDGAGGTVLVRSFQVVNLGNQPLTIASFGFSSSSSSAFHVTSIAGGTVLAPMATAAFSVTFDPTVSGDHDATLVIQSDGIVPVRNFSITGSGLSPFGDVTISVSNNNVGGRQVGLVADVTPNFATVKNAGASPLTITSVIIGKGVGEYVVTSLPVGFGPGNPIVLAPGAQFSFGLSFDPNTTGIRAGEIEIHSNDPDLPILRLAVTGTGLADIGTAVDWGHDFVLLEVGSLAPQRFRSDFDGDISTFLPANTPYTISVFDPESGLVWKSAGVSAGDGETTDLGMPFFAVSTAADTNNDGLPDDINFIMGPGPFFDFGTASSPLSPGYTRITSSTSYNPLQGYGWLPGGVVTQSDSPVDGITNELTRDFNATTNATFAVDLANGIYDVTLKVGDHLSHSQEEVLLEGDLRGNISTLADQYITTTYRVIVSDGQLTLNLSTPGGAVINALEVTLVLAGTFGSPGPAADATGRFAFAIENLDNGFIMRGTRDLPEGGSLCPEGITFAPSTHYRQWVLNIDTLEMGFADFTTPVSGETFDMPFIMMGSSFGTDTDRDGLDSTAEFILGTSARKSDTDGDGVSDKSEVQAGTNPIDGRPAITGVLATVDLQGEAKAISAEQSNGDSVPTVVVATGSYGVAFVDVTNFNHPLVMLEVNLAGDSTDVAFDGDLGIAAVASNAGGLNFVELDGTVRNIAINPSVVEMIDGFAYANNGGDLISFDALSGDALQTLTIGFSPIITMSHEGSHLFTIDATNTLRAFEVSSGVMIARGTLLLPAAAAKMFVGGGVAYIGVETGFTGGYMTVDVSNLNSLSMLSTADATNIPGKAIALNGSGLGVTVGSLAFVGGTQNLVSVVNTSDPTVTGDFIVQYNIPDEPYDIAIAAGFAFVADGTAGLIVVNYKAADNLGIAPTISLNALVTDLAPGTPGIQIQEGTVFQVVPTVSDDVQVRSVDLLVNGQLVRSDIAFPWDLFVNTPSIASGGTTMTVTAIATDTGGNTKTSAPMVFSVVPDTFAPVVVDTKPANAAKPFFVPSIDVRFSEPINQALLSLSGMHLTALGADNLFGTGDDTNPGIASFTIRERGALLSIVPAIELTQGSYRLTIDPAIIADAAGNHIAAPLVVNFTIRPASDVHALTGVPKIFQAPSANVGQDIGISFPGADSGLRLVVPTVDAAGNAASPVLVAPGHIDSVTGEAFFIVPATAVTGDINTTHIGDSNFASFPQWNVTRGTVDLIGQPLSGTAFNDVVPGNGLYVDMDGSNSQAGKIESKATFALAPGDYELRFSLAPSEGGTSPTNTVAVSLGSAFSESFTLNNNANQSFQTIVRTFTVLAASNGKIVFDQTNPGDNFGLYLDNVKLTNLSTGQVLLQDNFDFNLADGAIPLQIVPVVNGVDLNGVNSTTASFQLSGSGFIESNGTVYALNTVSLLDASPISGPDVFSSNNLVNLSTAYTSDLFGSVTVTTTGGTSAPFSVGYTALVSTALSGTPANAGLASANPGQVVTIQGTGLSLNTDLVYQVINDSSGVVDIGGLNPFFVNASGTEAQVQLPNAINGVVSLRVVGSTNAPQLQIVPVVTAVDVTGIGTVTLFGEGFVEANNSVYQWLGGNVTDTATATGPDVFSSGTRVNLSLPTHGLGNFTVTTAGGTSAAVAGNVVNAGKGLLRDIAIDRATNQIWVITNNDPSQVHRIDAATGLSLGTFSLTAAFGSTGFFGGLQFLQSGIASLGGTAVPAGSLLLVNGASNPDRIVAVNATTGAILATLNLTNLDLTSGVYDAASGHLFVASYQGTGQPPDKIFEIDPATGAVINSILVPGTIFSNGDIVHSGLAIDPIDGGLWLGSDQSTVVVKLNKTTGAVMRSVDLIHQGLAVGELTGIAFDGTGALWVSTTSGVLYKMNLAFNTAQPIPTITSITALAKDGTPASGAAASANAGQAIEIVGTGFGSTTEVLFAIRDISGNDGMTSVVPTVVNADGTRLQVIVPLLASTGQVKVTDTALRNLGFVGNPDAIHRDVTVGFTASGPTATIVFTDEGLEGIGNESWGLDNVRVRLLSNPATVLYNEDFEGGTGAEWNNPATDATTPWAFTEFLGRVSSDGRTLTVSGLTAGVQYQIVTDLYIIDSWDGTSGPDYFDVYVDGTQKFREAFSNLTSTTQTYAPGASALLQIVPVIYGMNNGKPGEAGTFDLLGSGFMEGASTITIGGIALTDLYRNQADDDVFDTGSVAGVGNDNYRISAPLTVEGPIRITTAGGFHQIAGPKFTLPAFVQLTGITAVAGQGAPVTGAASANTGQAITLLGNGFTNSTLVQFDAQDDAGSNGTLTRTGSANAAGTQLTVIVPELARTGSVRVVGDATTLALQIVPTLRSISGAITAGSTVVLEGTGLIENGLTILIDGQTVTVKDVRNILDNDTLGFPNSMLDQQIVTLTVPAGVSAGVIQVITNGGSFRMRATSATAQTTANIAAEVGDTLATAQALAVVNNNQLTVSGAGLNINVNLDVDMFSFTANAGDVLNISAAWLTPYLALRLFNAAGVQLGMDQFSGPGSTPLLANFSVPVTGTYYLGVGYYSNVTYNPAVAGSGTGGTAGVYSLTIKREDAAVSSISGITAAASTGTAAQASLPSANTGQTITLTGAGFVSGDTVVYETVDSNGRMTLVTITPATIAADGTSMTVVVPGNAATGMVRLARELTGRYLQIVPTITSQDDSSGVYHGGNLQLIGTGIYEQGLAVSFGGQTLVDRSPFTGLDAFSATGVNATVPEGAPTGPFRITTLGGTSAVFGPTFTAITATATSGTPASGAVASANPGQAITLTGTGLSLNTDIVFLVVDAAGNVSERVVNPIAISGSTSITVIVPTDAVSGIVQIAGDQLNSARMLQIVPVITNVDLNGVNSTNASFQFSGLGFVEDSGTRYTFNNGITVLDAGRTTGPDVFSSNTFANLTIPYSNGFFGSVTVTTAGGTSAPFSVGYTALISAALSGTPANAGAASANPGQVVTIQGTGLSLNTDLVYQVINDSGVVDIGLLNPFFVNAAGTEAQVQLPLAINGVVSLRAVGSTNAPQLQIVPVVTVVDVTGAGTVTLAGQGFVEASNSVYQWLGGSVTDTSTATGPDVFSSGTRVNLSLPTHGLGNFTVTTAGGTSAPLADNVLNPNRGFLRDIAIDRTTNQIWIITNNDPSQVHRIDAATGLSLGTFSLTAEFGVTGFFGGMQFLQTGIASLGGTAVPAGSLLLVNGAANPDRIVAVNTAGTILATLNLTNLDLTSGVYDAASGHLFVASYQGTGQPPDKIFEIDPANGAILNSILVPGTIFANGDIVHSGLAIDPVNGGLWLGSDQTTVVVELNKSTGAMIRSVDLIHQGLAVGELTGIAFDGTGALWVSTTSGVLYKMNLAFNTAQPIPSITSITALAKDGTPASGAVASANAGQAIEIVGTGFGSTTEVLFATRDNSGTDGVMSVVPTAVNADGTRLQVIVPLLATTGQVRVTDVALRHLGSSSSWPDAIYRDVAVGFTATGATATIVFTDEGLEGIGNESWGLDNVRVRLASNPATVLYNEDFEGGTGAEWNNPTTDATTPWAFTEFLGRVSSDGRTLTVNGLTPGVAYQIVTDLYILDSWDGTSGPDFFDVFVDGTQKFREAFSNFTNTTQTYAPGASAALQIVPVIYGMNGTPGQANVFDLLGSGFMEGASTITIGGIALTDLYRNQADDDVFDTGSVAGVGNDNYRISAPLTVEGPIRITTAGGFHQIAGPKFTPPAFVQLTGITAVAGQGAAVTGAASANTGQVITLLGNGFSSSTQVQFDAQDDAGVNGILTRTGTANAAGTQLTVIVPELARTGSVRVVGDATTLALQIVPTLRSINGNITAGSTVVLEGTGLVENGLTILIDGQTVTVKDVRNILDNDTLGFPNSMLDQQIVTLTVPAGVSAGVIQVLTNGGSFRMRATSATTTSTASIATEISDTMATAQALSVVNNNQLTVSGAGLSINVNLDVDMYSFTANAGDVLNISAAWLTPYLALRLFNAAGVQLGMDQFSGPGSMPLLANFTVPVTGTYYVGVSYYSNVTYDPAVSGSGSGGTAGVYSLTIKREDAVVSSISGITALAASGTAAQVSLPSANTGQTITLTGAGFVSGDQVVFETVDSNGRMTLTGVITPTTIAADGTSMTVVVPTNAATGMVRLTRELTGRYLQIVPTISGQDDQSGVYHGGSLQLIGTGIYEQGLAVSFGGQTLTDRSPFTGLDAFSNTGVNATIPEGAPTGPFRVTTLGGTSAAFGPTFTGVTATATSGTPASGAVASANPGQAITLTGTGLSLSTDVVFLVVDAAGNVSERIVNPTGGGGNTSMTVTVPTDAITGVIQIVGDQLNSARMLQIVPIVTGIDLNGVNFVNASFQISGSGFIEDKGTIYQIGGVTVLDRGTTTGPDVFSTNTLANLNLSYSDALFGSVTVTTAGGTSAPFSVGFTQLTTVAATGTPASGASPSANPGQVVTITGGGLTLQTDIVAKFYDDSGNIIVQNLNPDSVSGGGTQALLTIPNSYNGAFALHMIGSTFAPLLQIVPVVTAIDVNGASTAQISGKGIVEANGTVYHFGTANVTDTTAGSGPDVFSSGTLVNVNLVQGGPGSFSVTTAGGTSAPIAWNVIGPAQAGTFVDVAFNTAANELLVATTGAGGLIYRINPATGATIGSFSIPVQNSNNVGLDISPVAFSLHDTVGNTNVAIPAGSLIVFNGAPNPDRIVAMNPTTGAILATLNIVGNFEIVGGAVTSTGRIFVLDPSADLVREINPITGTEIVAGSFAAGMDITAGDIAVHPTTGNIWIASAATTTLREYTVAGVLVRSIDVTPQGVSTELTGLAFRPVGGDFDILASSNRSVIYVLPDPLVNVPTNVVALAGSTTTVPVNIDNANGLFAAWFRLTYDTDLLDVDADGIYPGSLAIGGSLVSTVDEPAGTIDVWLTFDSPLGPGSGSLVDIDYRIAPDAEGIVTLDLQSVRLNNGALILGTEPVAGFDSTDGMIAIHPPLRNSSLEQQMSFGSDVSTSGHDVESSTGASSLLRKGLHRSKGLLKTALAGNTVRNSNSIQWDRQIPDKAIRRAALQDWLILK